MKDKLEKFISDNRQQFDDDIPGDKLWENIAAELDKPRVRKINWKAVVWRSAAIIVIFIASYFFHDFMQQRGKNIGIFAQKEMIKFKQYRVAYKENKTTPTIVTVQNIATYKSLPTDTAKTVLPAEKTELPEIKVYYAMQIAEREKEINQFSASDPKIKRQINSEFVQLDSVYNRLRTDTRDNINNREVVEAMIQNFRMRLELLENILQQLKERDSQALNVNHK